MAKSSGCGLARYELIRATRDMEVDVQLNRFYATAAVGSAQKDADASRIDAARAALTSARIVLLASVSHKAKHHTAFSMLQEVNDALSRVQSRSEYDRGGHAMMQECVSSNAYQRSVYNKLVAFLCTKEATQLPCSNKLRTALSRNEEIVGKE